MGEADIQMEGDTRNSQQRPARKPEDSIDPVEIGKTPLSLLGKMKYSSFLDITKYLY